MPCISAFLHSLVTSLLLWWSHGHSIFVLVVVCNSISSVASSFFMLDWGLFEVLYMLNIVMMFESHIHLYNLHEIMH